MHKVEVWGWLEGLVLPGQTFVPHPHSAWAAGLPGQSGLARNPSGLTLSSVPP